MVTCYQWLFHCYSGYHRNIEIQKLSSTALNLISKLRVTCIPKSRYYGMIMLGLSESGRETRRKRERERGLEVLKRKNGNASCGDRIQSGFWEADVCYNQKG